MSPRWKNCCCVTCGRSSCINTRRSLIRNAPCRYRVFGRWANFPVAWKTSLKFSKFARSAAATFSLGSTQHTCTAAEAMHHNSQEGRVSMAGSGGDWWASQTGEGLNGRVGRTCRGAGFFGRSPAGSKNGGNHCEAAAKLGLMWAA